MLRIVEWFIGEIPIIVNCDNQSLIFILDNEVSKFLKNCHYTVGSFLPLLWPKIWF